jgi:hypothetical protein
MMLLGLIETLYLGCSNDFMVLCFYQTLSNLTHEMYLHITSLYVNEVCSHSNIHICVCTMCVIYLPHTHIAHLALLLKIMYLILLKF